MRASVFDISREKISEPASMVKGVSSPSDLAIPILRKDNEIRKFSVYLRDGGLSSTGLSSNEDGSSSNLTLTDHVEDDTSGSSGVSLANHTLRDLSGFEGVIETKSSNMGVSSNTLDTGEVLDFLDLRVDAGCGHRII